MKSAHKARNHSLLRSVLQRRHRSEHHHHFHTVTKTDTMNALQPLLVSAISCVRSLGPHTQPQHHEIHEELVAELLQLSGEGVAMIPLDPIADLEDLEIRRQATTHTLSAVRLLAGVQTLSAVIDHYVSDTTFEFVAAAVVEAPAAPSPHESSGSSSVEPMSSSSDTSAGRSTVPSNVTEYDSGGSGGHSAPSLADNTSVVDSAESGGADDDVQQTAASSEELTDGSGGSAVDSKKRRIE